MSVELALAIECLNLYKAKSQNEDSTTVRLCPIISPILRNRTAILLLLNRKKPLAAWSNTLSWASILALLRRAMLTKPGRIM
jgi:hypothetical protein